MSDLDSLELTRRVVDRLERDGLTWGQIETADGAMNLHPIVVAVLEELAESHFVGLERPKVDA